MSISRNNSNTGAPVLIGGGLGIATGAAMGAALAYMAGAFASGVGWIVIVHSAIAMMLMGAWLLPCFMADAQDSGGNQSGSR